MKFSGGVNHLLGQIQNGMSELGKVSRKKIAVLLNFVQITPLPPYLDNLHNFFRHRNSRFESQFQGGRSCTGARVAPAKKFGLRQKI